MKNLFKIEITELEDKSYGVIVEITGVKGEVVKSLTNILKKNKELEQIIMEAITPLLQQEILNQMKLQVQEQALQGRCTSCGDKHAQFGRKNIN